jgi:WD40 repeat protein
MHQFVKVSTILLVMTLIGCSPAPTSTLTIASPTAAPTSTSLPTNTPAPTSAPTPMPPPGKIMIVTNADLIVYPADSSYGNLFKNFLIPQENFWKAFPAVGEGIPVSSPYLSPDGQKLAVFTCTQVQYLCQNHRLYISTVDLKNKVEFKAYKGGLLAWSPTSDRVLIQGTKNAADKKVISARADDFGAVVQLPPADAAFWKYDGSQIYFYKDGWHVINSDGSNNQSLPCELCAMAPTPTSFAVAQSPDGKHIAIGYMDGTVFIVDSNNFSDFRAGSAGGYVSRLFWSPDGAQLAINVDTTTSQSDIVIMNTEGAIVETITRPEGVNFSILCGWSPDSQYVDYLTIQEKGFDLFLHKLGGQTSIQRVSIETGAQNCPIWLN